MISWGEKMDTNLTKAALHVSASVRVRVQGWAGVPSGSGLSLIQRDLFPPFLHKQPNVCHASPSQTWSHSQLKTGLKTTVFASPQTQTESGTAPTRPGRVGAGLTPVMARGDMAVPTLGDCGP